MTIEIPICLHCKKLTSGYCNNCSPSVLKTAEMFLGYSKGYKAGFADAKKGKNPNIK